MESYYFLQKLTVSIFKDVRGNLGVSDLGQPPIMDVRRLYYISEVPEDGIRGSHGHKSLNQIFYCLKGAFTLEVTDGTNSDVVDVTEFGEAYFVPAGLWRKLTNFRQDCVCLVLASDQYKETDYIYDFDEFKAWKSQQ